MITSIILLNVKRNRVNQVASQLVDIKGVTEVYSVSGKYDLVAIVRVAHNDDLATLVTESFAVLDDITNTDTMLAFKAFSKHDLESMFSL